MNTEQDEFMGMKMGADSTGKVMHIEKNGWGFVMRKIQNADGRATEQV